MPIFYEFGVVCMIRFTDERYDASKCRRIVNPKQAGAYMEHGVYPIDMYVGYNHTIVYVFVDEDTKDLYEKWVNYEL